MSLSRFTCPRCGSANQFNPAMGSLVACGTCGIVVPLIQQSVLVDCPGCRMRMQMDPSSRQGRCPRCQMIFSRDPPMQQPQAVQGVVATPGSPAVGVVLDVGSQPEKPDPPVLQRGDQQRQQQPPPQATQERPSALEAPAHFGSDVTPMPLATQVEEEMEWTAANTEFNQTQQRRKSKSDF